MPPQGFLTDEDSTSQIKCHVSPAIIGRLKAKSDLLSNFKIINAYTVSNVLLNSTLPNSLLNKIDKA